VVVGYVSYTKEGIVKGARRELQFQASQLLRFLAKWLLVRVSSSPGCVSRWGHQAELRISEKAHATICHRSCSEAPSHFLVQARAMRGTQPSISWTVAVR